MVVKKTWYEIIAPKMFGEAVIGETLAAEPKQIIGRVLKVSMADIDNKTPKFYLKMVFRVESVDGNKAFTKLIGQDMMYERIYRIVQRRSSRVDYVATLKTADGIVIRIKPLVILPKTVGTSVKSTVRRKLAEVTERIVSETSFEDLITMIISDKIQRTIQEECKKLFPIGMVEIKKTEVMGG